MGPQFMALGIVVTDMAETLEFYRHLGLEFAEGAGAEGHVEADTPCGATIMFDTEDIMRSFDASFEPPTGRGRIGLAFECAAPAEVDATHADLVALGYRSHLEPFDAFWGQRYATVYDPSGNLVDLYAAVETAGEGG
jgi:catechol 2,3-dioxygenase-like lactoylglutathione lyase family enzyme